MHLAQMNVATALFETSDPRMADFMNNLDRVNALAEGTPGFVWRLTGEGNNATDIRPTGEPLFLVNMSVWATVAALFDSVYRSDHRSIMVRRRAWFAKPKGSYQVLWWVDEGHVPTVEEGLARLRHLAEHGPTPHAFTFKTVFPESANAPIDLEPEPYCVGWA
jgi:hypothetical protein